MLHIDTSILIYKLNNQYMKKYNFDEEIERYGTNSIKYDTVKDIWNRDDLIPMWVADMDFPTPSFIIKKIEEKLSTRILGYASPYKEYFQSIIEWNRKRYGLDIRAEEIKQVPGVVAGIRNAIQALTQKGDNIMIMEPVYHPFRNVTEATGRNIINCPLLLSKGRYAIDFLTMETLLPKCKILIFCNPHNPGGFTWDKYTLIKVAELCDKHNVIIISDEIHADLTLPGFTHTPMLSVSDAARRICITLQSPSKAFNMPGVIGANAIIKNKILSEKYFNYLHNTDSDLLSVFSYECIRSCYTNEGEEWLNEMLSYVKTNIDYVCNFCSKYLPHIKPLIPEASFLIFLDCRELNFTNQDELVNFFVDKAHLALNSGDIFGKEGVGFMRLNVGCTMKTLQKAMLQLKEAYNSIY